MVNNLGELIVNKADCEKKNEVDDKQTEKKVGADYLLEAMIIALITLVWIVIDKKIFGKK